MTEFFPPTAIGPAFRGSVTIQSSVPVSIIGLQFAGELFSTLPLSVSAPAPVPIQSAVGGVDAVMFPQFAMSGGWASTLGLLNNTSNPVSGRIDIFDVDGRPMTISLNGSVRSTFTYSIPPRGTVLLAPRDSNGQSPF